MVARAFQDETVFLGEVVKGLTSIDGWTFTRCKIYGPMILAIVDPNTILENCNMVGTQEQILWEIPEGRTNLSGVLALASCRFRNCTFTNIGFAGYAKTLESIRRAVSWGYSPN